VFPRVVACFAELEMEHWAPLGTLGFVEKLEAGLGRCAVALAAVAGHAGADNIFPGGLAAAIAWNNVVEIEVLAIEFDPAVLAGVVIAFEDVVPGKFDFLLRHAIKEEKQDDLGHAYLEGHGTDDIGTFVTAGKAEPLIEGHGLERAALSLDDLRVALVEKHEGALDAADVDGLPETIQHEDVVAEDRFHRSLKLEGRSALDQLDALLSRWTSVIASL